jgi:two-component system nitrate/nitrite response regulator NarL
MRLVLCDDNRLLGEALAAALQARGYEVLAVTDAAAEGVVAVAAHQPDACLMDLHFPEGPAGLDVIRVIREQHPDTPILILSGVADPVLWSQVMEAGVAGFIRKDQNVNQIADALEVIGAGGVVFDPLVTRSARASRRCRQAGAAAAGLPYFLTPREREVLGRIAAGQSTGQMASEMRVTPSTLRSYVKSVLAKLGTHSRVQAAVLARREGLLAEIGELAPARAQ